MVKEAKKSRNSYDEVWVVFDRDRERDPQNLQAIELASQSKIKVAFSSISFEEWVLLHFERSTKAFERSDCESRSTKKNPTDCTCDGRVCICTYLKKHFYPGYAKGKAKLYDDLSEKRDLALENAAWQKHYSNTKNHHLANPYTDVDNLVLQLFELPKIRYESTNERMQRDFNPNDEPIKPILLFSFLGHPKNSLDISYSSVWSSSIFNLLDFICLSPV